MKLTVTSFDADNGIVLQADWKHFFRFDRIPRSFQDLSPKNQKDTIGCSCILILVSCPFLLILLPAIPFFFVGIVNYFLSLSFDQGIFGPFLEGVLNTEPWKFGLFGLGIAVFLLVIGKFLRGWTRLEVDRKNEQIVARWFGGWTYGSKNHTVPFQSLRSIDVRIFESRTESPNNDRTVRITFRSNKSSETLTVYFDTMDFEDRDGKLTLTMALASLAGMDHYRLIENDDLDTRVEFSTNDSEDWTPIPDTALDYVSGVTSVVPGSDSDVVVPESTEVTPTQSSMIDAERTHEPFDPAKYDMEPTEPTEKPLEVEWNPGRKVIYRYHRPFSRDVKGNLLMGFVITLAGLFISLVGFDLEGWEYYQFYGAILSPILGFGLGAWGLSQAYFNHNRFKIVELNWSDDTFRFREGDQVTEEYPFSCIEKLEVHLEKKTSDKNPTKYLGHLEAILPDDQVRIFPHEHHFYSVRSTNKHRVYDQLTSMANDLARELDCDWELKE